MLNKKNQEKIVAVLEHKNYKTFNDYFIAYPTDTSTVSSLVKLANKFLFNIQIVGSGSTDLSSSKSDNVLYLSTIKLNNIIEIDIDNFFINVQSGLIWSKLFNDLNERSMYFPLLHDKNCGRTIGGILSTLNSFSSAATYFKGIEFVSPTGDIIKYGCKTLKNVSGYDLSQFMIGSFGKFGVITSVLMKLNSSEKYFFTPDKITKTDYSIFTENEYALVSRIKKEIDPNDVLI
ncbi:MAG: FAD-binding oxidoreductase [Candidatus Delongbacteria bacterium]|nr:FAD-binding oxidoreductase [Candidatus Delongbacteria bacterium]